MATMINVTYTEARHRVQFAVIVKRGHLFTKNTDVTHVRISCFRL